jgi:hypothetical protein
MNFRILQARLLAHIRARVRNGEITERGIARVSGISQPHLHNVLKGRRVLSTDMADQILRRLRIDLAELMNAGEGEAAHQGSMDGGECRAVPLLDGCIGPGHPYPPAIGQASYPFPAAAVERLDSPVAAWLTPDARRSPVLSGGVVLLDCAKASRLDPHEDHYFALDLGGASTIGRVRRAGRGWDLWIQEPGKWQSISPPDGDCLDLIKGRVRLVVQHF